MEIPIITISHETRLHHSREALKKKKTRLKKKPSHKGIKSKKKSIGEGEVGRQVYKMQSV